MHIEFFVEEASAEAALYYLLPEVFGERDVEFEVHPFNGKLDLLRKLPDRLKAYRRWLPADWRIVVLVDRDDTDCHKLKQQLEEIAHSAGMTTRSSRGEHSAFQVLNRIAVEELEAWFFGDVEAIVTAYPRVPETLGQRQGYRDPDAIRGGTWEALERILKYYHPGGLEKVRAATEISRYMRPERNRSKSFQVFRDALLEMVT